MVKGMFDGEGGVHLRDWTDVLENQEQIQAGLKLQAATLNRICAVCKQRPKVVSLGRYADLELLGYRCACGSYGGDEAVLVRNHLYKRRQLQYKETARCDENTKGGS